MPDCVTYQGIKGESCTFTPDGGSSETLNLVTAISINPSVVMTTVMGDADIYPRCSFVSSGATAGSLTSTDIEAVSTAITLGVSGTLVWASVDRLTGTTVTNTIQACTFSDNSTPYSTDTPTNDTLSFTADSASNDGVTNPAARAFVAAP